VITRFFWCLAELLLVLIPTVAVAVEGQISGGSFGFLSSFFQMIAALLLVVGLILLAYYVSTRLMRKLPALRPGNQHIRLLEVRAMGPRKSLILIEVSGEYLLLASSGDQLNLIKQIEMLEEIEILEEPDPRPSFLSFLRRATSGR
jgi:flagellar protein FliO/FliZ